MSLKGRNARNTFCFLQMMMIKLKTSTLLQFYTKYASSFEVPL